jgi:hypothetical protein
MQTEFTSNYLRCAYLSRLLEQQLLKLLPSILLTQYCAGGKIEKNEMGGVCGAYEVGEKCAQGCGGET